jgi:hypothetical protein
MAHPPWHLWGNTQTVELVSTGAPFTLVQPQLAKISYGRPETWTFFFHVVVLNKVDTSGVDTGVVQIRYNLTLGVGRSHVLMNDFELFSFPTLPGVGSMIWSSSVNGPPRDFTPPATVQNVVDKIPAENLQLSANTILTGGAAAGSSVTLAVSAFFAPRTHVRPEWLEGDFKAGEDRGQ